MTALPKLLIACGVLFAGSVAATPVLEAYKTVERTDYSLVFDSIVSGVTLSDYQEDGIWVTTADTAATGEALFAGDMRRGGYHYGRNGNWSFTSIRGVNDELFSGADFLLGNGWSLPTTFLHYAVYRDGSLTGSGVAQMSSGTVRVSDSDGFDELRLVASLGAATGFGSHQAIALDDLHLQGWGGAVPEPASIALFAAGLLAWSALRGGRSR